VNDASARSKNAVTLPKVRPTRRSASTLPSFEKLVEEHRDRVARLCYRLTGWGGEVDDIVQDVFLAAFKGLPKFRGDSEAATWLTRIAINACRAHLRKRWLRLRLFAEAPESVATDVSRSVEQEMIYRERLECVRAQVRQLPLKYREAIVLRYLEELSVKEIADVLGLGKSAVEVRLNRARRRLHVELSGILDG